MHVYEYVKSISNKLHPFNFICVRNMLRIQCGTNLYRLDYLILIPNMLHPYEVRA